MAPGPPLENLRARLQRLGYRVRDTDSGIEVVLQLYCSVRVSYDAGCLSFDPRFGRASRATAVWCLLGFTFLAVLGAALLFVLPAGGDMPSESNRGFSLLIATGVVLMHIGDGIRYSLTEHFMTRAQTILETHEQSHNKTNAADG